MCNHNNRSEDTIVFDDVEILNIFLEAIDKKEFHIRYVSDNEYNLWVKFACIPMKFDVLYKDNEITVRYNDNCWKVELTKENKEKYKPLLELYSWLKMNINV